MEKIEDPVEILARRLCKELLAGTSSDAQELESRLLVANKAAQRSNSLKKRRLLRRQDSVFAEALKLAIERGWIGSDMTLTVTGETMARRSRAGTRRGRSLV